MNNKKSYIFLYISLRQKTPIQALSTTLKNEQGVAHQQVEGTYFAGQYRRLFFSSRKTKHTNLLAVNASAHLC